MGHSALSVLTIRIESLEMTPRLTAALELHGLQTIGDILNYFRDHTEEDFLTPESIKKKSLLELRDVMDHYGVTI